MKTTRLALPPFPEDDYYGLGEHAAWRGREAVDEVVAPMFSWVMIEGLRLTEVQRVKVKVRTR